MQPNINVGILSGTTIHFRLNGAFRIEETDQVLEGEYTIEFGSGEILFEGRSYPGLIFVPLYYETASFDLFNVNIGKQFHWERTETQTFQGSLCFVVHYDEITAINSLPLEDYLLSVISSEMKATSSSELLKAHAVISRSWLLAQLNKKEVINNEGRDYQSTFINENEITHWYDREEHDLFDVCADDHCQRYQGLTRASTPEVKEAIHKTYGEVLMSGKEICDARFSKCCGGITEEFENCWEPRHFSYLESIPCWDQKPSFSDWEDWIMNTHPAFCNTNDKKVLSQVLNDYDQETNHFYRWKVEYTQAQLSVLIRNKTGIDFGEIIDLIPEERGKSGRIIRLQVQGTKRKMFIGKELEIRKILSSTHLLSSAFIVRKSEMTDHIPGKFILHGAGWGHGVGLCQIGAAMMAEKSYDYREILAHYFKGVRLEKIYHS